MDRVLTDFVKALRNADVRVSPAETMDAVSVINTIGYGDKNLLKRSLSITLPKTVEEKQQFDICFDNFFKTENRKNILEKDTKGTETDLDSTSNLENNLLGKSQNDIMLEIQKAAEKTEISQIKYFTQRAVFSRRILEELGVSELEDKIRELGLLSEETLPSEQEKHLRTFKNNKEHLRTFKNNKEQLRTFKNI